MAYEIKVHRLTEPDSSNIEIYPVTINGSTKPLIQGDGKKIVNIEDLTLCGQETYIERRDDGTTIEWVLPHSKRFPNFIATHFSGEEFVTKKEAYQNVLSNEEVEDPPLFPYQKFIYEYMRYGTPYRGILLEHGLGSGKTRSAITVAESFRKVGIHTLVLTPAFLATNFEQELIRWVPEFRTNPHLMRRYYHFVSYNATGKGNKGGQWGKGSVFEQLARLGIGFPESDPDSMPYLSKKYRNLTPPKNMFILVDEAHGVNRSFISSNSKLRARLYRLLMQVVDCKIMYLSATPMIGNPFELVPLYNVLRGPITNPATGKRDGRAFNEHEGVFIQDFIARDAGQGPGDIVINEEVFMRHILGLSSYLTGFTKDETGLIYPRRDEQTLELEMSPYQSLYHDIILSNELEIKKSELLRKGTLRVGSIRGGPADMTINVGSKMKELKKLKNSYRTGSRQACNFAFPAAVERPRGSTSYDTGHLFMLDMATQEPIGNPFDFVIPEGVDEDARLVEIYRHLESRKLILYKSDLPDGTPEDRHRFKLALTRNIALKFDANPKLKKGHAYLKGDDPIVQNYLTEDDYYRYVLVMGKMKDRIALCLKKLAHENKRTGCFNMNPDPEAEGLLKYSTKMYTIYKMITTSTEVGASHVVVGDKDLVKAAKEALSKKTPNEKIAERADLEDEGNYFQTIFAPEDINETEDKVEEEEDEGEVGDEEPSDESDLPNVSVPVVIDPYDPFSHPDDPAGEHLKDVYMTDSQLDKKYGKDNWTIKGGPALVYSFYNTAEGAGIFSMILDSHGFKRFESRDVNIDPTIITRTPRYAFIKGGMSPAQKIALLKVFNHPANMHGQLIKVIFVTQAAAEGISLYNIRQVHVMEPFWDNVMIRQVVGRAFRLRSHYHLPFDERIVHVYHLIAVRSDADNQAHGIDNRCRFVWDGYGNGCLPTTDNYIKSLAALKDIFQDAFRTLRQKAAVDCHINRYLNETDLPCFIFPAGSSGNSFELALEGSVDDVKKKKLVATAQAVATIVRSATGEAIGIHTDEQVMVRLTMNKTNIRGAGIVIYEVPPGFRAGSNIDPNTLIIKGIQMTHSGRTSVINLRGPNYTLVVTSILDPTLEQKLAIKLGSQYQKQ